jgi:hypothetical protein
MPDDLKESLKRVLASQGKKAFFFAYALGKRKDKKGDGELIIRRSKLKKAEVEAALVETPEYYEGRCWIGDRPENAETVYFLGTGKKLSASLIPKMVKTAKLLTTRQYDFQLPSADEETRASRLSEDTGEEVPSAAAPADEAIPPPPSAPPPPPVDGTALMRRFNGLTAAIKVALTGPDKERIQQLFVAIGSALKNKDFLEAQKLLDELEPLVKRVPTPSSTTAAKPKSFVAMQQARLRWDDTRKKVHDELVRLEQAIMDQCVAFNNRPGATTKVNLSDLKTQSQRLYTILDHLDERLIDKLDEALNAQTTDLRQEKNDEAIKIIQNYQTFVNGDPFIGVIDDNGFTPTRIKQTFATVLTDLSSMLSPA